MGESFYCDFSSPLTFRPAKMRIVELPRERYTNFFDISDINDFNDVFDFNDFSGPAVNPVSVTSCEAARAKRKATNGQK